MVRNCFQPASEILLARAWLRTMFLMRKPSMARAPWASTILRAALCAKSRRLLRIRRWALATRRFEHGGEGGRVDRFALADGHSAGGRVAVAGGDDALGIRDDGAVVEEDVDVVLRRQQGGDVALQDEVGTVGALDGLGDLGVGGVDQIADFAAD